MFICICLLVQPCNDAADLSLAPADRKIKMNIYVILHLPFVFYSADAYEVMQRFRSLLGCAWVYSKLGNYKACERVADM